MRRIIVATAVCIITLLGGVAYAVPPEVETFSESWDFVVPAAEGCGDFDVRQQGTERVTTRTFVGNGQVVRIHVHVRGSGTSTNVETGDSISDNWAFLIDQDLASGTAGYNGTVFNINDQGHGIIVQDTGRVVFDMETGEVLEVHGPHEALDEEFLNNATCSALSS